MARSHANLALALLALLCAAGLTSVGGAPTTNPLLASKIRRAPAPAPGPSLARKGFAPAPGLYAADDCINQCEQNLSDSLAALATVNAAEGTPATDLGITDVLKYCQANCLAEAAAAAPSPDDCASQCTQSLELSALYADAYSAPGDTSGSDDINQLLSSGYCDQICAIGSGDLSGLDGLTGLAGLSSLINSGNDPTSSDILGLFGGSTPTPTSKPPPITTTKPSTSSGINPTDLSSLFGNNLPASAKKCFDACVADDTSKACNTCTDCLTNCDGSANPLACINKC